MPTFKSVKGGSVWFPRERIVQLQPSDGYLTTVVTAIVLGAQGPMLAIVEVEGTVEKNGAICDAQSAGPLVSL